MTHVSVNIFTVHPAEWDAFLALQRERFLPLLRQCPGFLHFEMAQSGPGSGVATLWWASEEARRAATPALQAWVSEHLDPYFLSLENPSGPLVLSTRMESGGEGD